MLDYPAVFRAETAALTDERIRTMNEVISGIRVIKMYGWEKPFASLVNEVRRYIHVCSVPAKFALMSRKS